MHNHLTLYNFNNSWWFRQDLNLEPSSLHAAPVPQSHMRDELLLMRQIPIFLDSEKSFHPHHILAIVPLSTTTLSGTDIQLHQLNCTVCKAS